MSAPFSELLVSPTRRIAGTTDTNGLEHTASPKLPKDLLRLELPRLLQLVWFDATNRVYNANGDTMINGVRYQYISGDGTYGNFLRRDIDKIYKRSSSGNCEYLLYDFGMDIGDTMVLN